MTTTPEALPTGESPSRVERGAYRFFVSSLPRHQRRWVYALWVCMTLLCAAYFAYLMERWAFGAPPRTVCDIFNLWVDDSLVTLAGVLCAVRAFHSPGDRKGWALFAAGIFVYTGGDIYWSSVADAANPPLLSWADLGFSGGTLLILAAVVVLARRSLSRFTQGQWLDAVTAALALLAAACAALFSPIFEASSGGAGPIAVNLLYPALDVMVLATIVGVFALSDWRPNIQWWLIGMGVLVIAIGDSYYTLAGLANEYTLGDPIDITWALSFALWGTASLVGHSGVRSARPDAWRVMGLPAAFTMVAVGVLAYLALDPGTGPLDWLSVFLALSAISAGLARLALVFHENVQLADARRQALHDPLTGLPNRRLLFERLDQAVAEASSTAAQTAVMVIDIDRFKNVNDALGHHAGDQMIDTVAGRLGRLVRPGDTAARMGGDEFVVIAPGLNEEDALKLAHQLRGAVQQPCELGGLLVHVELSVGVALFPNHGVTADALLQRADAAMYVAKTSGTGVSSYAPDSDPRSLERLTLAGEFRDAIACGDIFAVFQPKIALASDQLVGVEALARWRHPRRGVLLPDSFIALAEEGSLMRELTLHMIGLALAQCRHWMAEGYEIPVAVNLSARHVHDENLPSDVRRLLQQHNVPARLLELELTETAVMSNPGRTSQIMAELGSIGVRIAIDDFGTGESSLRRLQQLPIDVLKIDRSFVSGIVERADDLAIVQMIIGLAHAVNAEVVAEGVEDRATLELLGRNGCHVVQGYFTGRPTSPAEITSRHINHGRPAPKPMSLPLPRAALVPQ